MSNTFKPGDHAVHAVHGPGTITAVQMRDMPGGPVEYVSMEVDGMTILIPTTELEEVGLRTPISSDVARSILEMLADDPLKDPGHAARRRRNQSRLSTGDAEALAKVVRSLTALKAEREKSLAMRDMYDLRQATSQLVAEIAISLEIDQAEAEALVEKALATGDGEGETSATGEGIAAE